MLTIEDAICDEITLRCKHALRLIQNPMTIVGDSGDIFDNRKGRSEQLDEPDCTEIQVIARVIPASVIVEIGMPLTWWSSDNQVQIRKL